MMRSFATICGIVLTLGLCEATWAGAPLEYPRPCPTGCAPNVMGFGHFKTTWRQWPGEERLEQTNPRSIGGQVLPTPAGQELVPLPRPTVRPEPQPQPPTPGLEGGILPTPSNVIPETILPEPPAEPKSGILPTPSNEGTLPTPSNGGTLPGLPSDSNGAPIPGPFDEKPTPSKPSKPTSGVWQEHTKQTTAATMYERRDESQSTVISLDINETTDSRELRLGSYRADSIATTTAESPTKNVEPAAYATAESAGQLEVSDERATPPIALNGYCPVELMRSGRWLLGDLRWTVVRDGQIYRLSGPTQRQQFMANPEAFTPAHSGNDPVLAVDQHRTVPGQTAYCATYSNRLYMFSNAATQAQFSRNPQQYAVGK